MPALLLLLQAATAAAPLSAPGLAWAVTNTAGPNGPRAASTSVTEAGGARLAVRCDLVGDPVVSIQFLPRTRLRGFGAQPVTLQLDGGTPLTDNWELIGGGAIERGDAAVTTLASAIAKARVIKVRSYDASGAAIDLNFAGPPGDAPIRHVLAACGYQLGQIPARSAPAPAPSATPQS